MKEIRIESFHLEIIPLFLKKQYKNVKTAKIDFFFCKFAPQIVFHKNKQDAISFPTP